MEEIAYIQSPEQVIIKDEIHEIDSDLYQMVKFNETLTVPQIDHDIEIIKEEDVLRETGFFLEVNVFAIVKFSGFCVCV